MQFEYLILIGYAGRSCYWVQYPTLLFGMKIMFLSDKFKKKLESVQGSLMKRSLVLSMFSHHSKLLEALNIQNMCVMLSII